MRLCCRVASLRGSTQANEPTASLSRLTELREALSRCRLVLAALPTRPLARFDELDAKERQLTAQRNQHAERLGALEPAKRRLGRIRDPDATERSFLATAVETDERALSELRTERTRLQRELGDPGQVRSEREGIEAAIQKLEQDYDQVRDVLADQLLDRRPRWLTEALGDRPEHDRESETWDRASRSVAGFRLDHDISDSRTALGPEPSFGEAHRHDWNQAKALLERAQRQLGHQPPARENGLDLGVG
jgi:chromosome segregation ATPase